jgi:hypothetical protein
MKQTAVEWLEKELNYIEENAYTSYIDLKINQAKEIEKEQIIEAYETAMETDIYNEPLKIGKDYYNETFKSE